MTKEINNELLELTTGNSGCTGCHLVHLQNSKPNCVDLTEGLCLKTTNETISLIWKLKKKLK